MSPYGHHVDNEMRNFRVPEIIQNLAFSSSLISLDLATLYRQYKYFDQNTWGHPSFIQSIHVWNNNSIVIRKVRFIKISPDVTTLGTKTTFRNNKSIFFQIFNYFPTMQQFALNQQYFKCKEIEFRLWKQFLWVRVIKYQNWISSNAL